MGKKKGLFGEVALVTVISFFIVLGTTYILGTLTSGWHFVDDHEFLAVLIQGENRRIVGLGALVECILVGDDQDRLCE